jgi:hypothetical protein
MSAAIPFIKAAAPYISAASSAFSAFSSFSQGKSQESMYKLQAMQTQADSARKALQYEERANETLRRVTAANAANVSRRYAGGVLGLEGSSKLIETMNLKEAGRDFMADISNASNALMTGSTQADIFGTAGKIAARGGLFDAVGKLATGAYEFSKTYKTSETPKAAPATGSAEYWKGAA